MKSIAVLYGGRSGEHEVSLISASSILAYLDKDEYSIVPIGITKRGEWFLQHPPEWAYSRPENGQMRSLPPVERSERVLAVPGEGLWLETTTKGLQNSILMLYFPCCMDFWRRRYDPRFARNGRSSLCGSGCFGKRGWHGQGSF